MSQLSLTSTRNNGQHDDCAAFLRTLCPIATLMRLGVGLWLVLWAALPVAAQKYVETWLYSFSDYNSSNPSASDGANPDFLIQGTDGNFYGTIYYGGPYTYGTVFKITPAGSETVLYSCSGPPSDGAYPEAGLVQGADGNFYSTTYSGGAYGDGTLSNGYGTVFRLTAVPTLNSLSPASFDAGGSAFTLTVKGDFFQPSAVVYWNNTQLTTAYVSSTELRASIPASLIAAPGKAAITVVNEPGAISNKKTFTILLTKLKLTSASLTKNSDGSYTANLNINNVGYNTAPNVTITKATLGTAATSTSLPLSLGSLAAGASANTSLNFPASAGSSGQKVTLKVSGKFTGGSFSGSLKVTLP